jgi:hypothetical protein
MLVDFFQWIARRPSPDYERAFVKDVRVRDEPGSVRVERIILICWLLIAVKHVAVIWAVHYYHVPFHQLWVNGPTWLLAALATAVYYLRE